MPISSPQFVSPSDVPDFFFLFVCMLLLLLLFFLDSVLLSFQCVCRKHFCLYQLFNPLNAELNPICYLLALLGAHHFLHVSRIRVKAECTCLISELLISAFTQFGITSHFPQKINVLVPLWFFNLLKPTGYVMHHRFNVQQLYALPTLYLCVLYLSENKQRLVPLTS